MGAKLFIIAFLTLGLTSSASTDKVDPQLKLVLETVPNPNVVVSFSQSTSSVLQNVSNIKWASRAAKINSLVSQLEALRLSSQSQAISLLENRSIHFTSTWINNKLYIRKSTAELIQSLSNFPEVKLIREQCLVKLIEDDSSQERRKADLEWGIEKIEANLAWELPDVGNRGEGVVVGIIDSGARHTHEALKNNWRREDGWFDPIRGTEFPNDARGHGTHVTGIIAGSNGIGVAPHVQWIHCKGFSDSGSGGEVYLVQCGQFMLEQSAQVVSNSWGGGTWGFFDEVVDAWHAAGIIGVFAVGNNGMCRQIASPAEHPHAIAVGSTDSNDTISDFSSMGPTFDERLKPEVVAPGSEIRSAGIESDFDYVIRSGTSFSAPHVTGTIALLLSTNPNLTFEEVKELLQNNTDRQLGRPEFECDGPPSDHFPNYVYGYGRINAKNSLESLSLTNNK